MNNQPIQHEFQTSGPRLTYFEWCGAVAEGAPVQGQAELPVVFLVHATGFHARCWDQVVAALPPHSHVYAVDMRGHGRSENLPPYVWETFAQDVTELLTSLGHQQMVGVGHSMGGHCLTQVAGRHPEFFARLLLIDPVIFEPAAYTEDRYRGFSGPEDHPVSKRKDRWRDWQEMYERFKDRTPFALWRPQVLEDYCRYGVLPIAGAQEGGQAFELACPPLVESSVYLGNTETDVYDLLHGIDIPVIVVRGKSRDEATRDAMDFSLSPTWPGLAAQFRHGRDLHLANLTHFIPMQEPELVARLIVEPEVALAAAASRDAARQEGDA